MDPLRAPLPSALALLATLAASGCSGAEAPSEADPAPAAPVAPSGPAAAPAEPADPDDPPTARRDMHDMLVADRDSPRHPSDGGGRAWIETEDGGPARARVGVPGTWTVVYEVGERGIAQGGAISLLVDPFWYWSTPQTERPDRRGYCEVSTTAEGVRLEARTLDRSLLGVFVTGAALEPGEQVRIAYGAGEAGALPDRYADRSTRFWVRVDGDGDGVSGLVADPPVIDVGPGPAADLLLTLPSTAEPGEPVRLTIAAVDRRANALWDFAGKVVLEDGPEGVELPGEVVFAPDAAGRTTLEVTFPEAGVYTLSGRLVPADGGEVDPERVSETNPCLVLEAQPTILWGDLHGHSNLSDGTGTPEDFYTYARDVAALDVAALTDHDHWGVEFIDENPDLWQRLQDVTNRFHEPGSFVTLVAYEWTSWLHGHRHVLYFGDEGALHSSLDADTDDPRELWDALRGQDVLTFAHHSAGGPIATNWSIPPDPELEPVTEVVSVHGSSEAMDSPGLIYSPVEGNTVRDALDMGYTLGFVGSGDGHDGHPGNAHLMAPGMAGLAAILAEERTREAVLEALRQRRCYATNGVRIVLRVSLDGHRMGSSVSAADLGEDPELTFLVLGTSPLVGIEIVRSGEIVAALPVEEGQVDVTGSLPLADLAPGEYVYLRVRQEDRGMAWSSPFYVVD